MIQLADQLRLHLEHEQLWGATELPASTLESVDSLAPRHLLVLGDEADFVEGPVRELLTKMLTAIGQPIDTCQLVPFPIDRADLDILINSDTAGILGFGPQAAQIFEFDENDSSSNFPKNLPLTHTFGPAHLMCRAEDKAETWSKLQILQHALN